MLSDIVRSFSNSLIPKEARETLQSQSRAKEKAGLCVRIWDESLCLDLEAAVPLLTALYPG